MISSFEFHQSLYVHIHLWYHTPSPGDRSGCCLVKDIYAKKPEPRAAIGTTSFSISFRLTTKTENSNGTSPRITFSEASLFDNAVDKLSKAMSKLTHVQKGNKPYQPPYKPYVTDIRTGQDMAGEDFIDLPALDMTYSLS